MCVTRREALQITGGSLKSQLLFELWFSENMEKPKVKTSVDGTLLAGAQLEPKEPKEEEKMDKLPYLRGLFCFVFCFFCSLVKLHYFQFTFPENYGYQLT